MRNNFKFMSGLAALAIGVAAYVAPAAMALTEADGVLSHRRHKGKGQNNLRGRGRGKTAKPRKRSNRLTISKRVRNKHRKAARR